MGSNAANGATHEARNETNEYTMLMHIDKRKLFLTMIDTSITGRIHSRPPKCTVYIIVGHPNNIKRANMNYYLLSQDIFPLIMRDAYSFNKS